MGASSGLMKADPEVTAKLVNSATAGMNEANEYVKQEKSKCVSSYKSAK